MTPATKERIWTDEEFMALSGENDRYELIDGELVNTALFYLVDDREGGLSPFSQSKSLSSYN